MSKSMHCYSPGPVDMLAGNSHQLLHFPPEYHGREPVIEQVEISRDFPILGLDMQEHVYDLKY